MALRTYLDDNGNEWRVWPVTPSTGAGTLGASYQGGWLCFERTDGTDRRRLSLTQVPPAWEGLPDVRLDLPCRVGARAAPRRPAPKCAVGWRRGVPLGEGHPIASSAACRSRRCVAKPIGQCRA